ncbi:MAG: hypothetical protein U0350_38350 [Caldilineaceae bacterium]
MALLLPIRRFPIIAMLVGIAILLMSYIALAAPPVYRLLAPPPSTHLQRSQLGSVRALANGQATTAVLINEVDSDSPGTDSADFIELYGPPNTSLNDLCLVLFNGSNDTSYLALDLDNHSLNTNGYFVIGNAAVPNVGLTFANATLQNGPDAVALYNVAACTTTFPNNTPVTTANLVDALVYDTGTTIDTGLAPLLNPGQAQVNEDANNDSANQSSARCADGTGGARNTSTYLQVAPSPGTANNCTATPTPTPTNTVPPGSTATPTATPTVTPTSGPTDLQISKYSSVSSVAPGQLFTYTVIVNNIGATAAQNIVVLDLLPTNLSLSGSASIHVSKGTGAKVTTSSTTFTGTVTTLSVGGVVTITARALVPLNASGPSFVNTATVTAANDSTPGNNTASVTTNLVAAPSSTVLINEVDADTPGSDTAEFVELYGPAHTALDGLCLVFWNGGTDSSYLALDLDGYSLNAQGYFVVGNAAVANAGLTFANSALQNGPDAVALYSVSACSAIFPSSTPLTTANLVDALVYDTGKTIDTGLAVLLNAGQTQVDENANTASADQSSARCPDGAGGARNTTAYRQVTPSPGAANCTTATATPTATATATATPLPSATTQATATPLPTATAQATATPVGPDSDSDNMPDAVECPDSANCPDTDKDGLTNSHDIDSDGDGIPDKLESTSTAVRTGQALAPGFVHAPVDTDGDGTPDYLDTDSDNDTIPDAIEGHDANSDGVADLTPANHDSDNDGLDDAYDTVNTGSGSENALGANVTLIDTDGSLSNFRDSDDDGDGLTTRYENNVAQKDADGDGKPNYLDLDSDGDGVSDQAESGSDLQNPTDLNHNGVPDFLEATVTVKGNIYLPLVTR